MIFNGYEFSFCVIHLPVWLPGDYLGEVKAFAEGSAAPSWSFIWCFILCFSSIKLNFSYVELPPKSL